MVKWFNRRRFSLLGICVVATVVGVAAVGGAQSVTAAKKYPPQFPREGATKLFENEHVIVWEQVGRPKDVFVSTSTSGTSSTSGSNRAAALGS